MYSRNKNREIMTKDFTLEEILNSDFMNDLIETENKQLEEAGWTIEEVREFAKGLIK